MQRGFPRPQIQIAKCGTLYNQESNSWGGYGESWDNKTYPVPYTAESDAISVLNSDRMEECANHKLCVVCGDDVTEEIVSVMFKDGAVFSESGPFHEKCARLTEKMCPHIAISQGQYEFKRVPWVSVNSEIIRLNS